MNDKIIRYKLRRIKRRMGRRHFDDEEFESKHPRDEDGQFAAKEQTLIRSDKERDIAYRKAVESNDMKEAQRLVDEAAKKAGYSIRSYHGTGSDFTEFKLGDIGFHLGDKGQAEYRAKTKEGTPRVMDLFVKMEHPLNIDYDYGDWNGNYAAEMMIETEIFEDDDDINERLQEISEIDDADESSKALREFLKSLGYDGIVYRNEFEDTEDGQRPSYIAFDPQQIKSAEPVVKDEDGDVIPLSERFSESNPDIRGHGNISNTK